MNILQLVYLAGSVPLYFLCTTLLILCSAFGDTCIDSYRTIAFLAVLRVYL